LWGGYLYYLLSGLSKLTDVQAVVYRGYPDKAKVVEQYKVGRPIQWGAFSSTSPSVAATKGFTDQECNSAFPQNFDGNTNWVNPPRKGKGRARAAAPCTAHV
jgi:hypothetical protein